MTAEPTDQKAQDQTTGVATSRLTVVVALLVVGLSWMAVRSREGGTTQSLARTMRSVDYFARREAARKLGIVELVEPKLAITALIAAKIDTDEEVRREAVNSLGQLGSEAIRRGDLAERDRATQAVMVGLDDPEPRVREGALGALALLFSTGEVASRQSKNPTPPGDRRGYVARVVTMLEDPDPGVRAGAGSALSFLPGDLDPALPALLKAVALESAVLVPRPHRPSNRGIGPSVALRRARASRSSVPMLVEALNAPEPRVRILAASVLSRVGPGAEAAVPALITMLADPLPADERDDTVRAAAIALTAIAMNSPDTPRALQALKAVRAPGATLRAFAIEEAIRALEQKTPNPRLAEDEMPGRR